MANRQKVLGLVFPSVKVCFWVQQTSEVGAAVIRGQSQENHLEFKALYKERMLSSRVCSAMACFTPWKGFNETYTRELKVRRAFHSEKIKCNFTNRLQLVLISGDD